MNCRRSRRRSCWERRRTAHRQRYRTLSHRLATAHDLWSHGKARYLIVSGNRIDAVYDEPTAMRDGLAALGVPPEFVYRDHSAPAPGVDDPRPRHPTASSR